MLLECTLSFGVSLIQKKTFANQGIHITNNQVPYNHEYWRHLISLLTQVVLIHSLKENKLFTLHGLYIFWLAG